MTQAEQVKARIIEQVTGVAPTIHAEAGYSGPFTTYELGSGGDIGLREPTAAKPSAQPAPFSSGRLAALNRIATTEAGLTTDEALDAFRLGFPNVFIYRAFKALEARVAELEAKA